MVMEDMVMEKKITCKKIVGVGDLGPNNNTRPWRPSNAIDIYRPATPLVTAPLRAVFAREKWQSRFWRKRARLSVKDDVRATRVAVKAIRAAHVCYVVVFGVGVLRENDRYQREGRAPCESTLWRQRRSPLPPTSLPWPRQNSRALPGRPCKSWWSLWRSTSPF